MSDEHAVAAASLTAAVDALKDTTTSGFKGINDRLDLQNGRLRNVEHDTVDIRARMVTTKVCEAIRKTTSAAWRAYLIPVAVALTAVAATRIFGG
jgi:hypothetical protein